MAESEIRPTKPIGWMMTMSDLLRKPKELLNSPGRLGGVGLGDLVIGEAPEAWADYAHGKSPNVGGPTLQTARLDPRMVDVVTAPLLGMGGIAGAVKLGRRAIASQKATSELLRSAPPGTEKALTVIEQKYPGHAERALEKATAPVPASAGTTAILDPGKNKEMFTRYLDWALDHQGELESFIVTGKYPKNAPPGLRHFASTRELEHGPLKELSFAAEKQDFIPPR